MGEGLLGGPRKRRLLRHPAQVVVAGFGSAILVGTLLLLLPFARTGPGGASLVDALFTSTSAVCVTGLVTVDTPTYWSGFGQAVILGLIQVGGLGIMTLASLLGLLVSRRMGLATRLTAAAETKSLGLGDIRSVIKGVVAFSLLFEVLTAIPLTLRFWLGYDEGFWRGLYLGVFHSVSAFNNAGFALYSDSLSGFVTDPWICLPIAFAVITGGLGFPVILEIFRQLRPDDRRSLRRRIARRAWSLHTQLTVLTYGALLVVGTVFITASEWNNPRTLGGIDTPGSLLAGFFAGVMPRTAGFNSLDVGAMEPATLLGTMVLMFIGGGSAGTAGGIKVTTFVVLFFAIYAEVRGEPTISVFERRISDRTVRQALTVVLLAIGALMMSTIALLEMTDLPIRDVLFETTSAFATVGLSTGITADLPAAGQLLLVGLMFIGRLGPITLVSALALRERRKMYELTEGRPIIG